MFAAVTDPLKRLLSPGPVEEPGPKKPDNPHSVERLYELQPGIENDADEKVAVLSSLYDDAVRARSGREAAWFEQLYYAAGEQYAEWDPTKRVMSNAKQVPKWMRREIWDEIGPTIDAAVAILMRDNPVYTVSSGSLEGFDRASAEAGTNVLEYEQREQGALGLRDETRRLAAQVGTCAWEPEFDLNDGPLQLMAGLDGMPKLEPSGNVRINLLSPFEMLPSPTATNDYDHDYMQTLREVSVPWARAVFPEFADKINEEPVGDGGLDDGLYYLRMFQDFGRKYGWVNGGSDSRNSLRLVKTYLPASATFPNGKLYMVCGTTLVYEGDNPIYPQDPKAPRSRRRSPVFVFRHKKRAKCFWGDGIVTKSMISLQRELNFLASKSSAIVSATQRPITVLRPGTKLDDNPSPIIYTDGGNTPPSQMIHQVPAPPFPTGLPQMMEMVRAQMQRVGGIQDATRGIAPTQEASGTLAQTLQQQDVTRLDKIKQIADETEAAAWRYVLQMIARYWTAERMVMTVGKDDDTIVRMLKGANIAGGTDVFVQHDAALPNSRQAAWNLVTQLAQSGFLNNQNPAHVQLVFRLLKIGGAKEVLGELSADVKRAQRVIERMKQGTPQQFAFYDQPDVHVHEVASFMKTDEFEQLVAKAPQMKTLFEAYLAAAVVAKASGPVLPPHLQPAMPPAGAGAPPGAPPAPGAAGPPQPPPQGQQAMAA